MGLLKVIGVFTPEPWQGYGFSDDTKAVLAGGNVRVGLEERRRDRLAADDEVLAAVGDERGVVAVAAEALDHPEVALAEQPGRRADRLHQRLEIGHRRD